MQPHKRMGKGMMVLAWSLGLALLTYYFTHKQHAWQNPNQHLQSAMHQGTIEVILQPNRNNHYVFNGKINDQTVTFFVDTGATDVTIPASVAEQLGLTRGYPSDAQTANGTVTVYDTQLKSVNIGAIRLTNVSAIINPSMDGDAVLLGMSVLKNLQFSQKDGRLYLQATKASSTTKLL